MTGAEWYVEIGNRKAGPYTPDQIKGLLEDQEVRPHDRVTSDRLDGEWISVQELLAAYDEAVKRSQSFQAPPRPSEIEKTPVLGIQLHNSQDLAQNLFDALRVAKEKKVSSKMTPVSPQEWGTVAQRRGLVPPQVWLILTLTVILGVSVYGIMKVLNAKNAATTALPTIQEQPAQNTVPTLSTSNSTQPPAAKMAPPPTMPAQRMNVPAVTRPSFAERKRIDEMRERERERERDRERDERDRREQALRDEERRSDDRRLEGRIDDRERRSDPNGITDPNNAPQDRDLNTNPNSAETEEAAGGEMIDRFNPPGPPDASTQ